MYKYIYIHICEYIYIYICTYMCVCVWSVAVRCSALQWLCIAGCFWQSVAIGLRTHFLDCRDDVVAVPFCAAVSCSVLQCVTVRFGVLQGVVACYSVLQ